MPPGSPGIFRRRKSSTYEAIHNFQSLSLRHMDAENNTSDGVSEATQEISQPTKIPWPNSKDDYILKQIIGRILLPTGWFPNYLFIAIYAPIICHLLEKKNIYHL